MNAGVLSPLGTTATLGNQMGELRHLFDINYFGLVSMISAALPHLRAAKGDSSEITGRIILVSSGAATGAYSGWGAYSCAFVVSPIRK